jgi:acetolactate synthase-1/2/3 large subunit
MNGAKSLVDTLLGAGVDTCFANPGTSEMHFVAALDQNPGMRCVLGLHETVVTGMADGYWRIAGQPACTLLHCGPGLANGLANLHNARRARSGIVNVVGDQATYHRPHDAPLTADTDALARTVSAWVRTSTRAADVGRDAAAAVQAARSHPGQIATLILPSDASWDEGGVPAQALPVPPAPAVDVHAVQTAARLLRGGGGSAASGGTAGAALRGPHGTAPGALGGGRVLLLLAGQALSAPGQQLAWRVAQATGAAVRADFVIGQMARGRGCPPIERVPYVTDQAVRALAGYDHLVLVGAKPPVGFFAYPGKPSTHYSPTARLHVLARPEQDGLAALQALVDELGAPEVPAHDPGPRPQVERGAPTSEGLARTLAALLPEGAIVSDESVSYGRGFYPHTFAAAPHDWLHLAGGAIGDGLPVATGAAIGARARGAGDRRVVSLQADGSAMYSVQALWTQARERLPCTTILLNNRSYAILLGEYKGVGATPGPTAMDMLDLGRPELDWVKLAQGLGVEAARTTTLEGCADLLAASFRQPGPFLIDLVI